METMSVLKTVTQMYGKTKLWPILGGAEGVVNDVFFCHTPVIGSI